MHLEFFSILQGALQILFLKNSLIFKIDWKHCSYMINPYSEEIVLGVIEEIGYVLCLQNFGFLWKFLYFWGVYLRIFLNVLIEFLIRLLSTNMADMPFSHSNLWWAWLNHCCIDDQSVDIHSIGLGFNSWLRQADYTNNKWKWKKVVVLPIRIV